MRTANNFFLIVSYVVLFAVAGFIFFLFQPYDIWWAVSLPIVLIVLGIFLIKANDDSYDDLPIESGERDKLKFFGNILYVGGHLVMRILGALFKV